MTKRLLTILLVLLSFQSKGQLSTIATTAQNFLTTKPAPITITNNYTLQWLIGICDTIPLYYYTKSQTDSIAATITFDTTNIYTLLATKENKADSNTLGHHITPTYGLNNYLIKGGQTAGTQLQCGTSDSVGITRLVFGQVQDSISVATGIEYVRGKYNSEPVLILKNKAVRNGADQTRQLILGIGNGNVFSANVPFMEFGTSHSNTNPAIGYELMHFNSILFRSASSASNPMVMYGVGSGSATNYSSISFALGGYAGGAALTPTSGVINNIEVGRPSGTSGTFAPTSGTAQKHAISDISVINQTGSATGITSSFTNRSIALTSAYDYRAFYCTNNTGHAFYSEGTAQNHFVGRTTIGTTTDNTVDILQVAGDIALVNAGNKIKIATGTNASLVTATLSSGTVTVTNTSVTANSVIMPFYQSCSNCATIYLSAKVAGTSFTITSTNASDASNIACLIIN